VSQGIGRALEALAELLSFEGTGPGAEARSAELQRSFAAGVNSAQEVAFFAQFEPGGAAAARMLPTLSGLLIPARALSLSGDTARREAGLLPKAERSRLDELVGVRRALARQVSELGMAAREGKELSFHMGRELIERARRSFAVVPDATVRELEAALRARLEWLAMIEDRLVEITSASGLSRRREL